jgi:plasmid stabilization system protein ParE
MKYPVIITPAAEADVVAAFAYIRARSPMNAARWLKSLYKAIDGLGEFHGYGRAPEGDWLDCELRQKVFKSHRIVYSVDDKKKIVHVHFVRHGARRAAGERSSGETD